MATDDDDDDNGDGDDGGVDDDDDDDDDHYCSPKRALTRDAPRDNGPCDAAFLLKFK